MLLLLRCSRLLIDVFLFSSWVFTEFSFRLLIDNVTRGYHALYESNIVHRDIKPQNILVKYDPLRQGFQSAKITDFGISRILSEEQNQSLCNIAGTFFYMAPEVGANILTTTEYNYEIDMWSLGCVFYQCITGEVSSCIIWKIISHFLKFCVFFGT